MKERCGGALCIQMEAVGLDAGGRCLVIRGISDSSDSHENNVWRSYAAGKAAIFARELQVVWSLANQPHTQRQRLLLPSPMVHVMSVNTA